MRSIVSLLGIAVLVGCMTLVGRGEEWSGFRGPGSTGVTVAKDLPTEWSSDKLVWKAKVPGRGWSEPIIVGDKVIITSAYSDKEKDPKAAKGGGFGGFGKDGGFGKGGFGKAAPPKETHKFDVTCLDRTSGKVLWQQTALEGRPTIAKHSTNTYATETPATDGERIFAYFGMHGIYCYDLSGKQLWKKDLGTYSTAMGFGTAASPVADGERVFVQVDNEEKSFLVALEAKTGNEVWRAKRQEHTTYCSPILWKNKDRTELVCGGGRKVTSYEPATGKVLWELTLPGGQANSSPTADEERLYFGTSRRGPSFGPGGPGGGAGGAGAGGSMWAVKAGASGDITPKSGETTSQGVVWSETRAIPAMASPLSYQGHIYLLEQNGGLVTCLEAATGKQVYRERLRGASAFWASPWAYDGKVFCLDDAGTTFVLQAGPEFKLLGKNTISDQFWTSAAISGGSVILRGVEGIYCIKK
jgi:outer membrane protein assembly factor BamB